MSIEDLWLWAINAQPAPDPVVVVVTAFAAAALVGWQRTSGLTVSTGRTTGTGMVCTMLAGYLAPSVLGLGGVVLLATGRITALLWVAVVLLGALLLLIRNG